MAYITRRFDGKLLHFLIDKRLVQLDEANVSERDILDNLEKYFFVKVRPGSGTEEIIQLHDEMARLVRETLRPYWDNSGEKKQVLLTAVDQYYDQLITEQQSGDAADILRVGEIVLCPSTGLGK